MKQTITNTKSLLCLSGQGLNAATKQKPSLRLNTTPLLAKRLFFTLLLGVFTIASVFGQITPTSMGTSTSDGGSGVINITIKDPVSGLSSNTYTDFNIPSAGVVFDNTSKNASIILNQVANAVILGGTATISGTAARLIIASPGGITCTGCGFVNASQVDLATGNNYNSNDGTFDLHASNGITIGGSGLNATGIDLNLQTEGTIGFNQNNTLLTAKDFSLSANSFSNELGGQVEVDNFSATTTFVFNNTNSSSIVVADTFSYTTATSIFSNSSTISADNFFVTIASFFNRQSARITARNFSVVVDDFASDFINASTITNVADLTIVQTGTADFSFSNVSNRIASGNSFSALTFNVGGNFSNTENITTTGNFSINAGGNFENTGSITATGLNITTDAHITNYFGATLNAGSSNFRAYSRNGDFRNSGNISADALTVTAGGEFQNDKTITTSGNFTVNTAGDFHNWSDSRWDTGGIDGTHDGYIRTDRDASIDTLGHFLNSGNLSTSGNINIGAAGDFRSDGNVTSATTLVIRARAGFYNWNNGIYAIGDIDAANAIDITAAQVRNYGGLTSIAGSINIQTLNQSGVANNFFNGSDGESAGTGDISADTVDITADSITQGTIRVRTGTTPTLNTR